eukprot:gene11216-15050_t
MIGILPFLIQWLALSYYQSAPFDLSSSSYSSYDSYGYNNNLPFSSPYPPKSHWTLLTELQQLNEDEVETFLPQLCNILLDRECFGVQDEDLFGYLESILVTKCSTCFPFGIRVCNTLKAAAAIPSEGLFKNVLSNNIQAQMREERLRNFHDRAEYATANGNNLPTSAKQLRSAYFQDYNFLLDTLTRVGSELKAFPANRRLAHLKNAISQCNALLFNRMLSQGGASTTHPSLNGFYGDISPNDIAQLCPGIAAYSLHLPLQHSSEKVLRILRFVESECEVLPSKERCPFLVCVEYLEQDCTCNSDELYTQGHAVGVTIDDTIHGRGLSRLTRSRKFVEEISSQSNADLLTADNVAKPRFSSTTENNIFEPTEKIESNNDNINFLNDYPELSKDNNGIENENLSMFAREDIIIDDHGDAFQKRPYQNNPSGLFESMNHHQQKQHIPDPYLRGGEIESNSYPYSSHENSNYYDERKFTYQPPDSSLSNAPIPNRHNDNYHNNYDNNNYYYNYNHNNAISHDSHNKHSHYQQNSLRPYAFDEGHSRRSIVRSKTYEEKQAILRSFSPFGHLKGWGVKSFIVKSGDDLRKEVVAMQLIEYCQNIFKQEGLDIFLRPYQILSTGYNSGLVEYVEGAQSIDRIKKSEGIQNLKDHFGLSYGPSYAFVYAKAVQNFVKSLVGYSLVTYLLQVKDRHNANLLIDTDGHIIHIDYGFIFGDSPGFNINFESAPFKLTREYIDIMGGSIDSAAFKMFEDLFLRGFTALQKNADGLTAIAQRTNNIQM